MEAPTPQRDLQWTPLEGPGMSPVGPDDVKLS